MKKLKGLRFYCGLILGTLVTTTQSVNGQITIGSSTLVPSNASLLELKTQPPSTDNVTTDKGGLLLPRVMLENKTTLEPFISITSDDWVNDTKTNVKRNHAGLVVYNLRSSMSEADENKRFLPGIYTWDGALWKPVGDNKRQAQWFYPPAFNLPLKMIGTGQTFDLYKVYENQFNKTNKVTQGEYKGDKWCANSSFTGENVPAPTIDQKLYNREELDYIIVWYDNKIINNVKVDAKGIMTYDVLENDPDATSYMNLVFVVKD